MKERRDPDDFVSPKELREWLGIGKTFCNELLTSGEIPSFKIGDLRRIRVGDVLNWLEGKRYCLGNW